jgi:hypothetical protein
VEHSEAYTNLLEPSAKVEDIQNPKSIPRILVLIRKGLRTGRSPGQSPAQEHGFVNNRLHLLLDELRRDGKVQQCTVVVVARDEIGDVEQAF